MYYTFEVNGETYRLKLATKDLLDIEKKLGMNPVMLFGNGNRIPTITELITIIACSFNKYNHGISENDTLDIIDKWLDSGHTFEDMIKVVVEIYKVSGLYKEKKEENEKN